VLHLRQEKERCKAYDGDDEKYVFYVFNPFHILSVYLIGV
jgi:hypothetical protein